MKSKTVLYHSLFWFCIYLLWIAIFRSYSVAITKTMTVEFCYLIFITADYYIIHSFITPRFLSEKKYTFFISAVLITIVVSAWLRCLTALEMNRHFFNVASLNDFKTLFFNSLFNISLWVLGITLGKMLADRIQTERHLEMLEKDRVKNELDFLKAQINPHALFNSLNTIYGHIDKTNQTARNILLQFSELLRYQLYDCSAEKINLEKEIGYLHNFIAFHRLRKDENLVVDLSMEPVGPDLEIAPLLLVILVENAFKFVSSHTDRENRIHIQLHTKENMLQFCISNTKDSTGNDIMNGSKGIGLANLKRRLELLYPAHYELTVRNQDLFYETILNMDLT
jgi:two-component system LytT family sensor kinase